jgi:hypothetical protein
MEVAWPFEWMEKMNVLEVKTFILFLADLGSNSATIPYSCVTLGWLPLSGLQIPYLQNKYFLFHKVVVMTNDILHVDGSLGTEPVCSQKY